MERLPTNRKPIGCRWLFKLKRDEQGQIARFKARLVVRGFSQRAGVDYDQLFSPVARFDSLRTILAVASEENLNV